MTPFEAKREFDKSIEHIIAAYRFFVQAVPDEPLFASGRPVRVGKFEFEEFSQAEAMLVELGWAFLTRCEGCLEALVHRLEIRGSDVLGMIKESEEFSSEELDGYEILRELRNIFHHGDGDWKLLSKTPQKVRPSKGSEPHLFPEHIEQFYSLICKIADCITRPRLRVV
jgi:hypothetical protein